MPFELKTDTDCVKCPYGYCVSYIREASKKMKDRDTQYRLSQNIVAACAFDSWIPAISHTDHADKLWSYYVERTLSNGRLAGAFLEKQSVFGETEKAFFLSHQQQAKVSGDIFEILIRAVLWNSCIEESLKNPKRQFAAITLGDNYNLKALFTPEAAKKLSDYEEQLTLKNTLLCYSTPDVVALDISNADPAVKEFFMQPIANLGLANQTILSTGKSKLEGSITPQDVLFAAGIKTSIRSDRMYQFLFEANAWKFIWRMVFKTIPSKYYTLMVGTYGADPAKLAALDFVSAAQGTIYAERAIDGYISGDTPARLAAWFKIALEAGLK